MNRVCIYHGGCPDGFGAAFAVWRAWGDDARYISRGHDDDKLRADEFSGALLAFVDIAPNNDELSALADTADQLILLDHHVSSQARFLSDPSVENKVEMAGHHVHFDLAHSGAVLAWQHFHPTTPVPELLQYVEDQDLWNWKLPDSDAVNAAIASYPREFEVWDRLAADSIESLVGQGQPILRANRMEVERRLEHARPVALGTRRIEAVNASTNRSQIGHELARRAAYGEQWGLVYRVEGAEVFGTLYSIGDLDISKVAVSYGGGGHKNAAGFRVTLEQWMREFVI